MMVVHEDNQRSVEVASIIRKPHLEQKSYVIVKNHVRELANIAPNTTNNEEKQPKLSQSKTSKLKRRKSDKTTVRNSEGKATTSHESDLATNQSNEIDPNDLAELKSVYKKCKEVMRRIETKYGHLMNLESETELGSRNYTTEHECQCKTKKKIVFDDEGRQLMVDTVPEKHICIKRMKFTHNEEIPSHKGVEVEYQETAIELPDSIQELQDILHDLNIPKTYRNQVVNKIRILKQEYANDIRFNRHILIEKLKANADEVLNFKGSNLSTMPGYPA